MSHLLPITCTQVDQLAATSGRAQAVCLAFRLRAVRLLVKTHLPTREAANGDNHLSVSVSLWSFTGSPGACRTDRKNGRYSAVITPVFTHNFVAQRGLLQPPGVRLQP